MRTRGALRILIAGTAMLFGFATANAAVIIETASLSGESITIYDLTVTCTSGRFSSVNAITSSSG